MTRIIYLFLFLVFLMSAGLYFIDANAADTAPWQPNAHHCDSYENLADYTRCILRSPKADMV
ncbi:hypothetical protein [Ochrobactrum teleogrylli]|uniref:Uncharacterized protein n=1 Tax=Ochrobactrum teleogrylli TaxID=2479765 RepID=A0ABY2Y3B0_9HYPH|nr:hypothetical protein [[Ochrobactrum] teleogrylli]TNV15109.1 hypothetical protein FIC94_13265 [[Ochrobactrum] teleogrylli]